jgi:hypothetical protein
MAARGKQIVIEVGGQPFFQKRVQESATAWLETALSRPR